MSKRLEILNGSLVKKNAKLDTMFSNHFATVREANGQPLNDKRNGQATLNKWDRQSDAIRNQQLEVKKTEEAIEREEGKIIETSVALDVFPVSIKKLIHSGVLIQWRKHPHIMFVDGVDKARILWKGGKLMHKYVSSIKDKDQYRKFAKIFNQLNKEINTVPA